MDLIWRLPGRELAPHLYSIGLITPFEHEQFLAKTTRSEKNEHILLALSRRPAGVLEKLLSCLDENDDIPGVKEIAKTLREKWEAVKLERSLLGNVAPLLTEAEMARARQMEGSLGLKFHRFAMSGWDEGEDHLFRMAGYLHSEDEEQAVLKQLHKDLIWTLPGPELVPHLYTKGLITHYEHEQFLSKNTLTEKNEYLLLVLSRRPAGVLEKLLSCLDENNDIPGVKEIAKMLREKREAVEREFSRFGSVDLGSEPFQTGDQKMPASPAVNMVSAVRKGREEEVVTMKAALDARDICSQKDRKGGYS
jgi:hypothetical protein